MGLGQAALAHQQLGLVQPNGLAILAQPGVGVQCLIVMAGRGLTVASTITDPREFGQRTSNGQRRGGVKRG